MVAEERRLVQLDGARPRDPRSSSTRPGTVSAACATAPSVAAARIGTATSGAASRQTFHLFRDGDAALALGLGVLDGELFGLDACPDLEPASSATTPCCQAIWALSTFEEQTGTAVAGQGRRRVSYAALDVEELGSVYEGLLELHPKADAQPRTLRLRQRQRAQEHRQLLHAARRWSPS